MRLEDIRALDLLEATEFSRQRIAQVTEAIRGERMKDGLSTHLGYVVSGSLGRLEALEASDVDLIALCAEDANLNVAKELDRDVRARLRKVLDCDVSRGENFTGPTKISDVVGRNHIGGNDDHVNLLTKRMILLTESRAVDDAGIDSAFREAILNAFISSPATRRRHFTSLVDEIVRYYRTLAIDYKSRVDHEGKAWAPRYIKLRHSRKYWFFSLVLGLTDMWTRFEACPQHAEGSLVHVLALSPTERIISALSSAGLNRQLDVVSFYNEFLRLFRDPDIREELESIKYDERYDYTSFRGLKRNADRMHRSMIEVFDSLPANWRRHVYSRFLLQS